MAPRVAELEAAEEVVVAEEGVAVRLAAGLAGIPLLHR